jgi:DNA-binding transcriptional ArsR family regulator
VYFTLNPLDETMLALRAGRMQEAKATATDGDVIVRRLLLVDLDPRRRSGISSTDAEHSSAIERARQIRAFLCEEKGWPEPLLASSGNGAHLLVRVSLPAESDLVERALKALHALFSDESVHVDMSVYNPGRISKLYGTLACKGDSLPERPHRIARIISAPEALEVVTSERLEELIGFACAGTPEDQSKSSEQVAQAGSPSPLDVQSFLDKHNIVVHHTTPWRGGTKWVLASCPMDESHGADRAAFVLQFPNGAIAAGCLHARCKWTWKDLRDRCEPRASAPPSALAPIFAAPSAALGLTPGTRVRAGDRGNVGTIQSVAPDGASADVLFVSREGTSAVKTIPLGLITVLGSAEGKSLLATPRTYRFLGLDDILSGKWPEYVVDGILQRGNLGVIYGAPASYKTFLALDLAVRVAIGAHWHGTQHRTRPAVVVYVMAEGQLGLRLRLSAWMRMAQRTTGADLSINPVIVEALRARLFAFDDAVPLMEAAEVENFITALEHLAQRVGEKPGLIVFDTLARCFLGGDENSSRDMGVVVEACNTIQRRTGAAVILIHHTGKDDELERGSSALRGAADSMLKVTRGDPIEGAEARARVAIEKRKDGAREADLEFDLWKVDLDPQSDGEPVSSLAPTPTTAPCAGRANTGRDRRKTTSARQQELEILASLATTFRRRGASASILIPDTGVPRSTAYKRLSALAEGGYVEVVEQGRFDVYVISEKGRERLSRESPSLQLPETEPGQSTVSEVSTPPLRGVETGAETETRSAYGEGARG